MDPLGKMFEAVMQAQHEIGRRMTMSTFNRVWCKVMLQRYLGAYLDSNLSVDQMSLELANGYLELENLDINTKAVSFVLAQCNVPVRLIDGYVGRIKIEIPWMRLMTDPTKMVIEDLQLTFKSADVVKLDDQETLNSMIESVLMNFNTDDMARSVFDEVSKEEGADIFDGDDTADSFAGFINAVYSRFCLTVNKLTLRFENEPKEGSGMATAVEIHCVKITFMDEQMRSCEMDHTNATDLVTTQPHGVGSTTNLSKNLTFSGVSLYTDVFSHLKSDGTGPQDLITSMHIRREKARKIPSVRSVEGSLNAEMFQSAMSNMDAFHSCYDKLTQENSSPDQLETLRSAPAEPELFSDPIKFAEVLGDVSVVFKIKNGANDVNYADIDESKIETDVFIKGFNVFATPSQIEIAKRYFSSILTPKEIVVLEQGKPMGKEDYEAMTKNMEPNQIPSVPLANLPGFGSNWQTGDVFKEFEDKKSNRQKEKDLEKERFKSLKANGNVKEEFTINTHIGTLLMYITHCDYLSSEYASQHGGYANVLTYLRKESINFFQAVNGFSFLAKHGLATIRDKTDTFYSKDHLRIVGGSMSVTSSNKRVGSVDSFLCRVVATHFDVLEFLTPESVPGLTEPLRCNILNYDGQENVECDPNFKLVLSTSSDHKGHTKVDILLGACSTELDFSIIDRISNLIVTKPFFDDVSMKNSGRNRVPQLKDDIYATTTTAEEAIKTRTTVNVKCSNWKVDLRIPKADLRDPNGARLPYNQRHVHNEYIQLAIKDIDIKVPIEKELSSIDIFCTEMIGDFCGQGLNIAMDQQRFLHAARAGLEKINLTLTLNPKPKSVAAAVRKSSSTGIQDIMLKSMSADIMMAHPKKEGPFSKVPRTYCSQGGEEKEEIVQAGTRKEIMDFQRSCETFASTFMLFTVPSLKLHIPAKEPLEILYNRLVNDLALFQPAAPAFRPAPVANVQPLESFQECISPKNYDESDNSDFEDEIPTMKNSFEENEFDRDKPHTFVMTLNANKCVLLCNTSLKEEGKEAEQSQVCLDLDKVHIGTTAGYHGDLNHTYFHFTSTKAGVGHTDSSTTFRIPNATNMKDFGKWTKETNQMEYVAPNDELSAGSTEDAFAVALHMHFRPDVNVKDVLLGIALRNSQLQARPLKSWGNFWMTQLADLFTLQDYAIPGYELPAVSTDLHICFENVIVGYDHSWVNPNSKMKLKGVFGQCNLASSIVSDMNISKTLCIFENCRLYMGQESLKDAVRFEGFNAPKMASKQFIPFLDIGSVQLDVLFSVGEQTEPRTAPAFEIRCQNDIIKAWACADSLATFIKIVMEYTNKEQVPLKSPEHINEDAKNEDITKSTATESVWSDASTGTKYVQQMAPGVSLPEDVDRRLQAMIQEAVNDDEGQGIAIGEDAVREFMDAPRTPTRNDRVDAQDNFEQIAQRAFKITDEEFCMVDDNIFGSGITNTIADSRVRNCSQKEEKEEGTTMKNDFFQILDDAGNFDGMYQSLAVNMNPVLRYFIKDITVHLSLYAGNDLSTIAASHRTYCTEDYKHGSGPEQKLAENSVGGPHRDHSAFVILELSKITYLKQIFEKTAPLLSSTLFQIGDLVLKDRVRASTIQEMIYQYSCSNEPRRSKAPIFSVTMTETHEREGKMRASMMPLKVNVDQDTLEFLFDFFEDTTKLLDLPKTQSMPSLIQRPIIEVPAETNSRKSTPKTSTSSSENEITRMYPSIPDPSLTMEPLKPSPVNPTTPLGDLSYLEKISQNHSSPVKRPIIDAPLTASAVSIGAMFGKSKHQNDEDEEDMDPVQMEALQEEIRQLNLMHPRDSERNSNSVSSYSSSSSSEDLVPDDIPDLGDLDGDWADNDTNSYQACLEAESRKKSPDFESEMKTVNNCAKPDELKPLFGLSDYDDETTPRDSPVFSAQAKAVTNLRTKAEGLPPLKMPHHQLSNDDILCRSTMMGSVHPSQSVHNLVDTSDDTEEHENFLDSIDDDDDKEKTKIEHEMEDQKMGDAAAMNAEIQEAVERGETFFKEFVFSPSVNIYVDYQGKRKISVEKAGALVGLLMAFGQLNQMPVTLRRIETRNGMLGAGRCLQHALGEWSGDLLTNMPNVIASYGPISPLVQIGRGFFDLFWMPVSEFRKKDGNIVKGVQRGVGSFSVSSAAGIVGMAQTVTGLVQSLAEMTMNEIKPDDPSTRRSRRYNRNHGMNPTDVRHSLQLAYGILYDGYHQTRDDLELAAQEDRASGNSVVRSAFRYAVPTFLGPVVMATQVTYQLLGGLRNQLRPDAYQDERRKWGDKDVPGGVHK